MQCNAQTYFCCSDINELCPFLFSQVAQKQKMARVGRPALSLVLLAVVLLPGETQLVAGQIRVSLPDFLSHLPLRFFVERSSDFEGNETSI